jgi:phosphoribosylglycinamide formyltransferase 1
MIRLALLASGTGTNAENIIRYFTGHALLTVGLVVSNHPDAKVLQKAARHKVPGVVFDGQAWKTPAEILNALQSAQIDYLILAGFLLKIPDKILEAYPNKILNIHPALLPAYGGKGMYGVQVHQAVITAGETKSGITIHVVNEHYDDGKILFQAQCPVLPDDTPHTLAKRIHELEYRHFPKVIEQYIFPDKQ